jgi:hypothetical protein
VVAGLATFESVGVDDVVVLAGAAVVRGPVADRDRQRARTVAYTTVSKPGPPRKLSAPSEPSFESIR